MSCDQCQLNLPPDHKSEEGDIATVPCCGTTWEYNADENGDLFWENTIDGEIDESWERAHENLSNQL
jgi:hypothetical protein